MEVLKNDKGRCILQEVASDGVYTYFLEKGSVKDVFSGLLRTKCINFEGKDGSSIKFEVVSSRLGKVFCTKLEDENKVNRARYYKNGFVLNDFMMGASMSTSRLREPGIMDRFIEKASNAEFFYSNLKMQGLEK